MRRPAWSRCTGLPAEVAEVHASEERYNTKDGEA